MTYIMKDSFKELDLTSFKKAIKTLEEALILIKMIKRYLEMTESSTIDEFSFMEIIRLAYEKGLIQLELIKWKEFRNARNLTSQTYNEIKAKDVFGVVPMFLI